MRLAIISPDFSDLSALLLRSCDADFLTPAVASKTDLSAYDAIAVLGGTDALPFVPPIDLRLKLEAYHLSNRPVFYEYCNSFRDVYTSEPRPDVADRLVWIGSPDSSLSCGDLLDDHANSISAPYSARSGFVPLLYNGGHVMKHEHLDEYDTAPSADKWVLWQYDSETLVCSIRLCNFLKARFAPLERWQAVIGVIFRHLGLSAPLASDYYPLISLRSTDLSPEDVFNAGLAWFDGAELYLDNGKSGVREGLSHNIHPDGIQERAEAIRNDCSGEVGGANFFDWLLHGTSSSLVRFENLNRFCFDKMQIKDGLYRGMMRWTTTAWVACYQDDVARTILGALLAMKFTESRDRLSDVEMALDFLIRTTGTDGLRVSRTDLPTLTEDRIRELAENPSHFACAHHNAYYHAVLLLAYQLDRNELYLQTAVRGLSSLMAVFPNTIREHSETQELCRLVLPLAILYETTKNPEHLQWLERITARLDELRHSSDGYVEYDTGYKANRSRTSGTESSLLADNGDEVADLLYSTNWLSLGFAYAWYVTGNEQYHARWQNLARFFARSQAVSSDKAVNGSWSRGIDLKRMEIYGVPHDIGWGPACVESGWTVAEILMGLGLGLCLERGIIPRKGETA